MYWLFVAPSTLQKNKEKYVGICGWAIAISDENKEHFCNARSGTRMLAVCCIPTSVFFFFAWKLHVSCLSKRNTCNPCSSSQLFHFFNTMAWVCPINFAQSNSAQLCPKLKVYLHCISSCFWSNCPCKSAPSVHPCPPNNECPSALTLQSMNKILSQWHGKGYASRHTKFCFLCPFK